MRVAIIGSGIAGLGTAWQLRNTADVTLFEKNARLGGHSHTVMAPTGEGSEIAVDTGFIVFNQATYPNLIALFDRLAVETIPSDMSFAASLDDGKIEYAGDNLLALIGHWRNACRPSHWRMLADLMRFMRQGPALSEMTPDMTLGDFLDRYKYSRTFRQDHLLPMAAAIWSTPSQRILEFPAQDFGNFFRNHGLLEMDIAKRPGWRTVKGGSRVYVERLVQASGAAIVREAAIACVKGSPTGAQVCLRDGTAQDFDHVVIAAHADEALALLPETPAKTRDVLGVFHYAANDAYLHRDETLMPRRQRLWASWNYMRPSRGAESRVFVSYWMNRLQALDRRTPFFVSLNPPHPPAEEKTILHQVYHHPQFDLHTRKAQAELRQIQGHDRIWLCGSYCGFGFHEDALASGLAVATALGAPREWTVQDVSPAFANATPVTLPP
jgi:predicted NAD/FAD-binding protein